MVIGGSLLSMNAGLLNATALDLAKIPVTHATGTVTNDAIAIVNRDTTRIWHLSLLLIMFLIGGLVCSLLIVEAQFQLGRRYSVVLLLEAAVIFVAWLMWNSDTDGGEFLLALAAGVQNAMATSYSGAVLRTTHMTGIATDISIHVGKCMRYWNKPDLRKPSLFKLAILAPLFIGFWLGAIFGHLAVRAIKHMVLLASAGTLCLAALLYLCLNWTKEVVETQRAETRHRQLHQEQDEMLGHLTELVEQEF